MNTDELINYLLSPVGLTVLVIGIAELLKKVGYPTKYIPLVDLAFGILGGVSVFGVELKYGVFKGIIIGIAIGLSACGLFSGVKNIIKNEEDDK
ncbi:MAG: holin [Ruminococcus sp.]|nr:holin [Ruminococcus sp.]